MEGGSQCNGTGPKQILIETSSPSPAIEYKEDDDDDTPVQVIIVSLWYWWKEVVIISITTAILLNFMLTQRLLNATAETKDAILPVNIYLLLKLMAKNNLKLFIYIYQRFLF